MSVHLHNERPYGDPITAEAQAYEYVLEQIRLGVFRAGDRLIAENIAHEIGVSRMPMREAFRRLSSEGLLHIRPNRGVIVRGLNAAEMREAFEMRAVLEAQAARAALAFLDDSDLYELDALVDRMEHSASDTSRWVTAHRHFHEFLARLARRPRLGTQIGALHALVEPHMRMWLEHRTVSADSLAQHRALLTALKRGDAQEVEKAFRQHIERTIAPLEKLLSPEATGPGLPPAAIPGQTTTSFGCDSRQPVPLRKHNA